MSPFFIILKILILSTIVWIGYTLQHESATEVEYVVFFLSGAIAEGAIVLMNFVKFLVLNTSDSLLTLKVIKHYVPLSGLDFVDLNVFSFPLLIILKNISLFHILYLLFFSYSFGKLSGKGFHYSSNLVIISLSLGMLIYLLIKVSFYIIF